MQGGEGVVGAHGGVHIDALLDQPLHEAQVLAVGRNQQWAVSHRVGATLGLHLAGSHRYTKPPRIST